MAEVVVARVLHEVFALLIYRIICQMHAQVVKIATDGCNVVLRCKPRQPLIVDVDAKRNHTRDKDIYAQIELQVVDEERFVKIALSHIVLTRLKPFPVPRQEDTFALAAGLGLDNEGLSLPIVELLLERLDVLWEEVRVRKEAKVLWEVFLHGY